MNERSFFPILLLAIGIALAGWFVGNGFMKGRTADRFVTVKGVSEREVIADVALWPLSFAATDDELSRAQAGIRSARETVVSFLKERGFTDGEIEIQRLSVSDAFTDRYRDGAVRSRYVIEQTLMVRTSRCEKVREASQALDVLVEQGVVLSSNPYAGGPTYLFTGLSDLKPAMIAEATAKARRAAEQFATDSGSEVGGIRRANQGVFVILARDRAPGISEAAQMHKTVRVVSTIEYFLED